MERKPFDVQVKELEQEHQVMLEGELDLAVAARFRSAIEPLIPSKKPVVLNLKNLTYIDSTGMGIIIFLLKARADEGNELAIVDIPSKIKRLFDLTGITQFLPDHIEAVKADGV